MAKFKGFSQANENWFKFPLEFIEAMPLIETLGEALVVLYVIRHTWGYGDDEKRITEDEFINGRKKRDGSRIDNGTKLTAPTVRDGIRRALKHRFIFVEVDDRDRGRIKKFYRLNVKRARKLIAKVGVNLLPPDGKKGRGENNLPSDDKNNYARGQKIYPVTENNLPSDVKKVATVQRKNSRTKFKKETIGKELEDRMAVFDSSLLSNQDFQNAVSSFEREFFPLTGSNCHLFEKAWRNYPDLTAHKQAIARMKTETENPNLKFFTAIVRRIYNGKKARTAQAPERRQRSFIRLSDRMRERMGSGETFTAR
ncbi:MAG TPA: hypothetical protein VFD70_05725 [Anaerolineae bacterium]|nr:hypothetical protein [Anaerolineae bacterium]